MDLAGKRGEIIRHLEDALAIADEIEDGEATKRLTPRMTKKRMLRTFVSAWGNVKAAYSPDSIVRSSRKRISSSLLVSEITKRTRPWLEVSA
jgi:hypothetical protein